MSRRYYILASKTLPSQASDVAREAVSAHRFARVDPPSVAVYYQDDSPIIPVERYEDDPPSIRSTLRMLAGPMTAFACRAWLRANATYSRETA